MVSKPMVVRDFAWDDEGGVVVLSVLIDGKLHAMRLQPVGDPVPVAASSTPDRAIADAMNKPQRRRRLPGEPDDPPIEFPPELPRERP